MKTRAIFSWILIVPVALLFGLAAITKLGGMAGQMFIDWGYPPWFAFVIGAIEGVGAVALLIPRTMRWSVYLLTIIMVGAAITHVANAEGFAVLRPAIFAGGMWVSLYLRHADRGAISENDRAIV